MLPVNQIVQGNALSVLQSFPSESIDCIVTSPPYNQSLTTQLKGQLLYKDDNDEIEYLNFLFNVFRELYRVLKSNGSFFYNFKSDTKNNIVKPAFENLIAIKGRFLIVGEIIWKYAGNFDSYRRRFPIDYEFVYHLAKENRFKFFDLNSKLTSVWSIKHVMFGSSEKNESSYHPCPFPVKLVEKCITHTTEKGDIVLDPFIGSGTTAVACKRLDRNFIGIEISPDYCKIAEERLKKISKKLNEFFNVSSKFRGSDGK